MSRSAWIRVALFLIAFASYFSTAVAADIYRCPNADGKIEFRDKP